MSGSSWGDGFEDDPEGENPGDELAALDHASYAPAEEDDLHLSSEDGDSTAAEDEDLGGPEFTITDPSGKVSVTAYLTGQVKRVDFDPCVVRMTERELAEEVRVLAELARNQARSVVHAFLLEGLARMGHDRSKWKFILSNAIQLSSPEQAAEDIAEVFAARYSDERG